ncbi:uncharacterized protein KY384_003501 [Bacidia gigantensis]|uniref:uncharacterized protein n=1 Tax=Bacidia gigantensis TaxID=2732470 RepID=UPI001D04144E|nr:uncharacterized protein KY384_003501 [Bacidia gigantensis]KAG8531865.1 hypothetical protein KY384_003501 [Bacidia gigantensis]
MSLTLASTVKLNNGLDLPLLALGVYESPTSVEKSRYALQLDYIDLYLVHSPLAGASGRHEAWLALQDAVKEGKVKSIGVSNFSPAHIEQLLKSEGVYIQPAVNQIEMHPWNQQKEIVAYCKKEGIVVQAHTPLTQGKKLGDPMICGIAKKHGKTAAQVVLRWLLQQDVVAIPKSENPGRIKENADIHDFTLDQKDLDLIATLDQGQNGSVTIWNPWTIE